MQFVKGLVIGSGRGRLFAFAADRRGLVSGIFNLGLGVSRHLGQVFLSGLRRALQVFATASWFAALFKESYIHLGFTGVCPTQGKRCSGTDGRIVAQ